MQLISVITVTFNCEKTIEKTIKSVLRQPCNIEYIIIDGKSNDKTRVLINKYRKYIDYYVSEADSGIYNAMNKGLSVASGDAVIFLNSGDYFVGDIFKNIKIPSLIPVVYKNLFEVKKKG